MLHQIISQSASNDILAFVLLTDGYKGNKFPCFIIGKADADDFVACVSFFVQEVLYFFS